MPDFIARLRAAHEAATPGPWIENGTLVGPNLNETDASTDEDPPLAWITFKTPRPDADRALDILVRNNLPAVLAALEAAKDACDHLDAVGRYLALGTAEDQRVAGVVEAQSNALCAALAALDGEEGR